MSLSKYVAEIDQSNDSEESALTEKVAEITIADLEELSIRDISAMKNHVLRDLVNQAIQDRLAFHVGGAYTTAPSIKVGMLPDPGAPSTSGG
jgi:hypothetical protein